MSPGLQEQLNDPSVFLHVAWALQLSVFSQFSTGTTNLQNLFNAAVIISVYSGVSSFCLLYLAASSRCISLCFCFVLNQNQVKVLFTLNNSYVVKSCTKICCVHLRVPNKVRSSISILENVKGNKSQKG